MYARRVKKLLEFYMVFSEIYNSADKGIFIGTKGKIGSFDFGKFIANKPDLILANGMAYKYMPFFGDQGKTLLNKIAQIFNVAPGEMTRWYVGNADPRGYYNSILLVDWLMKIPSEILNSV